MEKMEWGMPVDLPLAWVKLWSPNFVEVLDFSVSKGTDHFLKQET